MNYRQVFIALKQLSLRLKWKSGHVFFYLIVGFIFSSRKFLVLGLNLSALTILFQYLKSNQVSEKALLIFFSATIFYATSVVLLSFCNNKKKSIEAESPQNLKNFLRTFQNIISTVMEGFIYIFVISLLSAYLAFIDVAFFIILVFSKIVFFKTNNWIMKVFLNPTFSSNALTAILVFLFIPLDLNFDVRHDYSVIITIIAFYLSRRLFLSSFALTSHLMRVARMIHKFPNNLSIIAQSKIFN